MGVLPWRCFASRGLPPLALVALESEDKTGMGCQMQNTLLSPFKIMKNEIMKNDVNYAFIHNS